MKRTYERRIQGAFASVGLHWTRELDIDCPHSLRHSTEPVALTAIIELGGQSGTGKSTFLEYLRRTSSESDGFVLLRTRIRLHRAASVHDVWPSPDEAWRELWRIHVGRKNKSPIPDARDLVVDERWSGRAYRNEASMRSIAHARRIVTDHSLACVYRQDLPELHRVRPDLFDSLMFDRALVWCRADVETNLRRIRDRESRGEIRSNHSVMSDEDLIEHISTVDAEWVEYRTWLESVRVPVLELDTGQSLEAAKGTFLEFVAALP